MSRAHIHGYDSNPEQFARMGNPWDGEPVLKRRAKRRPKRPECRAGLPRRPERSSRDESEAFLDIQAKQDLARLLKAHRQSRTVVPAVPQKSPTLAILPNRSTELMSGWERFERQVIRVRQRAEVRARCEAADRIDERARLEATIAAASRRLAELEG